MPEAVVVDARTGRTIQTWQLDQTAPRHRSLAVRRDVPLSTKRTRHGFAWSTSDAATAGSSTCTTRRPERQHVPQGLAVPEQVNTWGNGKVSTARPSPSTPTTTSPRRGTSTGSCSTARASTAAAVAPRVASTTAAGTSNAFWSDGCYCMTFGDGGGRFKPARLARHRRPRDDPWRDIADRRPVRFRRRGRPQRVHERHHGHQRRVFRPQPRRPVRLLHR